MTTTTFLSDADIAAACDWPRLIAAIRSAYSTPVSDEALPPRTMARADGAWLRTLSGAPPTSAFMGFKLIAASTRNSRVSYLAALFDRETTELVALLDAARITATRTAATSALAADLLARPGSLRVAVIGSGLEARNHVLALAATRALASVTVYSPTDAKREALAEFIRRELGVEAIAVERARYAVGGADLVIAAARSRDESPTVHGTWLAPGTTVISIGSTLPEQHEVDTDVIRRAALIVADVPDEVADQTGDMIDAAASGDAFRDRLHSLHELVAGTLPARRSDDQIVLYKSVGSALQDLAVAELCLRRARELGIGTPLPLSVEPVLK
jgi:ornithine cyclodeaminase/alanine dehydrogenase-like protein (mu-crystallin family)